jgi:sugar phosphate isomerase/epimerase
MNPRPSPFVSRRQFVRAAAALAGGGLLDATAAPARTPAGPPAGFRFCLNMSTIRGQNLSIEREIDVAGRAGYDAIEPWLGKLHEFVARGGSLRDLRKRIEDHGMTVESAIGFATWIVNDEAQRAKGLEEAKRDMAALAAIGGVRMAASPAGVGPGVVVSLDDAAARYRALLELGEASGITPQIEMWGGNPTVGTVAKAAYIALQSGHPRACFLGDAYHTYKGGCDFSNFALLSGRALQVFHLNDYPAEPSREALNDSHRVYPGDGVAPLVELLKTFRAIGAAPVLSLELFNKQYWARDALEVAATGLAKMREVAAKAMA